MNAHLVKAKGKGKVSCEGHNQPIDLYARAYKFLV